MVGRMGLVAHFQSLTKGVFTGRLLAEVPLTSELSGVVIEVGGRTYYSGRCSFLAEDDDPLRDGFRLR